MYNIYAADRHRGRPVPEGGLDNAESAFLYDLFANVQKGDAGVAANSRAEILQRIVPYADHVYTQVVRRLLPYTHLKSLYDFEDAMYHYVYPEYISQLESKLFNPSTLDLLVAAPTLYGQGIRGWESKFRYRLYSILNSAVISTANSHKAADKLALDNIPAWQSGWGRGPGQAQSLSAPIAPGSDESATSLEDVTPDPSARANPATAVGDLEREIMADIPEVIAEHIPYILLDVKNRLSQGAIPTPESAFAAAQEAIRKYVISREQIYMAQLNAGRDADELRESGFEDMDYWHDPEYIVELAHDIASKITRPGAQ